MNKLITFAIPAYNSELYIESCVKSILMQFGNECEIIIVDDGSTDSTPSLCDNLSQKDNRITVIHTANYGVSHARNTAIRNAHGTWISFVDADDMLSPYAAAAVNKYAAAEHDIVYFDTTYFRRDDEPIIYRNKTHPFALHGGEIFDIMLSTIYYTESEKRHYTIRTVYSLWGKMIKTEFLKLNGLYLDEGLKKSEDMEFNFRCLKHASSILISPLPYYRYRHNKSSVTKRYMPNITEYNRAACIAFENDIKSFSGDRYTQLKERCTLLRLVSLIVDLRQSTFHRKNPASRSQMHSEFDRLISSAQIADCREDLLLPQHLRLYHAILKHDFKYMLNYFRREQLSDALRSIPAVAFIKKLGVIQRH